MEQLKLNNEILQKYITVIKKEIEIANDELANIDVKDITLKDLIHYKSKIKETIHLSKSIKILDPLAENYFLASASIQSMEQIQDRMEADNEITTAVKNATTLEVEKRINTINSMLESDNYKDVIHFYDLGYTSNLKKFKNDENNDEQALKDEQTND